MSRYVPTKTEVLYARQLEGVGWAVVRQRTYTRLLERARVAEALLAAEVEHRQSTERWAHRECDEQRRLSARLTAVCTAAASLGVPIDAINAAIENAPLAVRGFVTYDDGSQSPIERWVRASDERWVSLPLTVEARRDLTWVLGADT